MSPQLEKRFAALISEISDLEADPRLPTEHANGSKKMVKARH